MMNKDSEDNFLSNQKRENIKNFELDGKLKKIECNACEGTGLKGVYKLEFGGSSWSGEYCEACKGLGYKSIKLLDDTMYICRSCNASGYTKEGYSVKKCKICGGSGFVDWITHIRGEVK